MGRGGSNSFGEVLPAAPPLLAGDMLVTQGLGFPRLHQPLVPLTARSRPGDEGVSDTMGEG